MVVSKMEKVAAGRVVGYIILNFQHGVHKKFRIAVGDLGGAAILFCDSENRGKTDTGSAVFGGEVSVFAFFDLTVKAVGGDDIQHVSVADFCGKAEISRLLWHSPASCDGVLHDVSKQSRQIQLGEGKRLRKLDVPVRADSRAVGHLAVVAEQGVQRGVGAVGSRRMLRQACLIFRKVCPDAVGIAFFRKRGEQADGVAEVVAQPCGLTQMLLQGVVLV